MRSTIRSVHMLLYWPVGYLRFIICYLSVILLKHDKSVVCTVVITISSTALYFLIMTKQDCFASEYIDYRNYKYQIQFQYPEGWVTSEKISRQNNGTDIMITKNGNSTAALFWIKYGNITALESDLQSGLIKIFNIMNGTYPSKEFIVMEPPSFTTINGLKTGTFLYALADRYGDSQLDRYSTNLAHIRRTKILFDDFCNRCALFLYSSK